MALLNLEQIKAADDKKTVDVDCPEWGGSVRLRSINGDERDELEAWSTSKKGEGSRGFRAFLVGMTAIDEAGDPLFNGQAAELFKVKNAKTVERLFSTALKLTGLNNDDVEVIVKNSDEAPVSDSG